MKDLTRLTLEERVGQLFFLGFQGTALDEETASAMEFIRPGGIVFLQRNVESLDQLYALNLQLQVKADWPLFLAMDQEGGVVDRLKHVLAPTPGIPELAGCGLTSVRAGARLIASELEAAGLNTSLGPILDLGLAGSVVRERALGASSAEVARFAKVLLDEFEKKKIVTCGRHFPGLGGAVRDPHFVLPRIERSRRQILEHDIVPFIEMADRLDMVMVSHAHYPSLGDIRPRPASLSKRVHALLRRTVGFRGIIVTDDLTMGAVTAMGLTTETFLRAIRAGNDMVLFSQTTPLVQDAFQLIVDTARVDRKLRNQIDESVTRILHAKKKLEFVPLRNRGLLQSRLVRQIHRLQQSVDVFDRLPIRPRSLARSE